MLITNDWKMNSIFRYIDAIAPTSQTLMITGETGTGKELVARSIHNVSGVNGNFVPVNVAGLDDFMFSDALFGHRRGAFTSADRDRRGLIDKAANGTLFLDEIGDLNNSSQVKLLRLLQDGEYYPLGSDSVKFSLARIIVATNSNLEDKMLNGAFRKDLYYRLCAHHIHLPPLRERSADIPLLVSHFMEEASRNMGRQAPLISTGLMNMLVSYQFPGNIRELKGIVSNAVAVGDTADIRIITERRSTATKPAAEFSGLNRLSDRPPTLKEAEDYLVREALSAAGGNMREAAARLGITRQALSKRLLRAQHLNSFPAAADNLHLERETR